MAATVKDIASELIEQLPDDATWEYILYTLYVRQQVDAGLEGVAAGRVTSHEEVTAEVLDRKRHAS